MSGWDNDHVYVRVPDANSPGLKTSGISTKFGKLLSDKHLYESCSDLRLTTPTVHVAWKIANREPLTGEELGIAEGLTIQRGPSDFLTTPMVGGQLDSDSGILSALEELKLTEVLQELPTKPDGILRADYILLSTYIRMQSLSVLWDLADGVSKASPHGTPKPWVIDELQILGLISIGEPVPDGSPGRPPKRLVLNSWGKQLVEVTRKYMGIEITDAYRGAARRKPGHYTKPRFTMTDRLASGYLSRGKQVPERIAKKMSEFGKQELAKSYGVEL